MLAARQAHPVFHQKGCLAVYCGCAVTVGVQYIVCATATLQLDLKAILKRNPTPQEWATAAGTGKVKCVAGQGQIWSQVLIIDYMFARG